MSVIGTLIPALAPAIAIAMGAAFASELANDVVDVATGTNKRAKKAIVKKATMAPGTGNTLADLEAQLQKHKDEALEAINKSLNKNHDTYEDAVKAGDNEDGILRRIAELEVESKTHEEDAKNATTPDIKLDKLTAKAKADKKLASLRKIDQSMAQAQKNLDEKKDRESDKEERKKQAAAPKTP